MVLFLNGDIVYGLHDDNEVKQLPEYLNDENVIVVDKDVNFPSIPDDNNIYINKWDSEKQEIYLECIGEKPKPPTTLDDVKTDTDQIQSDNLIVMMAQAEQYEEQMVTRQDILTIMAAIAELYEMNSGGVK